jgi:hypothetical protein
VIGSAMVVDLALSLVIFRIFERPARNVIRRALALGRQFLLQLFKLSPEFADLFGQGRYAESQAAAAVSIAPLR